MLIDTIKDLFEGKEKLFKGLWLEDKWDFSKRYPVIKIDFGAGVFKQKEELKERIFFILKENQGKLSIDCENQTLTSNYFEELIPKTSAKYDEKVVILIDEYDKPILDNIENPEVAQQMREELKNLYSVLKSTDAYIKFGNSLAI